VRTLASRGSLDIQAVVAGCSTGARFVAAAAWRQDLRSSTAIVIAPTGLDRISVVIRASAAGSEKRNPRQGGDQVRPFRRNSPDSRGSGGGSGSRLASPCPVRRGPGARGSKRDINCNLPTAVANVTDCPSTSGARVRARSSRQVQFAAHIKNPPGSMRCGTSRNGAPCRSLAPLVTAAVGRSPALCTAAPKSDVRESI
jgi:hypothetical protein